MAWYAEWTPKAAAAPTATMPTHAATQILADVWMGLDGDVPVPSSHKA